MQKKSRRIVTAVVTALFVLSISYFALLSPTTAWYYQDATQTYDFTFASFDVEQIKKSIGDLNVELRAATRFADVNENLFDEVVRVIKIQVNNYADDPALIHCVVNQKNNTPGLRWFLYGTSLDDEITEYPDPGVDPVSGTEKGAYKKAIEGMLTSAGVTPITYVDEADYASKNPAAETALQNHNDKGLSVDGNSSQMVYIVLWAEYGDVVSTLKSDTVQTMTYDLTVDCIAEPYHAQKATLQFVAPEGKSFDITYKEESSAPQIIHVNGTTEIQGNVGEHFRITIPDTLAELAYDPAATDGTVSVRNSKLLTGTVNSTGNVITIVQQ